MRTCQHCGIALLPGLGRPRKYCSERCSRNARAGVDKSHTEAQRYKSIRRRDVIEREVRVEEPAPQEPSLPPPPRPTRSAASIASSTIDAVKLRRSRGSHRQINEMLREIRPAQVELWTAVLKCQPVREYVYTHLRQVVSTNNRYRNAKLRLPRQDAKIAASMDDLLDMDALCQVPMRVAAELQRLAPDETGPFSDPVAPAEAKRIVEAWQRLESHRNRCVVVSQGFAWYMVQRHCQIVGLETADDLVQDAQVGLLKAICRFDCNRGTRFSTYAGHWIMHEIRRSRIRTSKLVRRPNQVWSIRPAVKRARVALHDELGRDPTVEELARKCDTSTETIKAVLELDHDVVSDLSDENCLGLVEELEEDLVDVLDDSKLLPLALQVIEQLPKRQREIVKEVYALGREPRTLELIGRDFDLSRERVRQIAVDGIQKIRQRVSFYMRQRELRGERSSW